MRIALVSTMYRAGGAERSARELFHWLRERGHEVRMLVSRLAGGEPEGVVGVRRGWEKYLRPLERLGGWGDWRHVGSRRVLGRIGAGDFDVVHLHNLHGGWMSLVAARELCRRVPSVWTLHDEWAAVGLPYDLGRVLDGETIRTWFGEKAAEQLDGRSGWARRRLRFYRSTLPRPGVIVCPSRYLVELARGAEHLAGVPVRHVPYGVTMAARAGSTADRAACRAELGLAPDARVLLLVAADFRNPFKGMRLAKETLARLGAPVVVVVLGSNAQEIDAAPPLEVRRLGFVSDEGMLARVYRAADVTLVPSVADNLPYVSLESLSCGTPVAAFEVGGLVDVVGSQEERGVLAKRFDTGELATKVRRLLDNPQERGSRGEAGRRWVVENCDMESWVKRHLDLYAEARREWAGADLGRVAASVSKAQVTEGGA